MARQETLSISKDMTIEKIFATFPDKAQKLAQIMTNAGLHCVGCHASTSETIEEGMKVHSMKQEEVESLINDLNKALSDKEVAEKVKEKIGFTDFAAGKCKGFRKDSTHMFKISLVEGSCGWTYEFKFKETKGPDEVVFEDKGVKILMDRNDVDKLRGTVVDYVDGLQGAGFKILNPNAKGTCGCGSSVIL